MIQQLRHKSEEKEERERTLTNELRHLVQLALGRLHHAKLVLARHAAEESGAEVAVDQVDAGAEDRGECALEVRAGDVDKVAVLLLVVRLSAT